MISEAYIRAIVAKAGCDITPPGMFDTGEDFEIYPVVRNEINGRLGKPLTPLHIQLKSSYDYERDIKNGCIKYDLDVKNYNQLVEDRYIPFILVLYCMPEKEGDWLNVNDMCTILKYCGYWVWLKGKPTSSHTRTERISIPMSNIFTDSSLNDIIKCIQKEDYDLNAPA